MQANGELPGMFFNVLPSVRAAWLQRFFPLIGRQIPLAMQGVRRTDFICGNDPIVNDRFFKDFIIGH